MADDPVVAMKFQPMKAGNRLEDKTETMTSGGLVNKTESKVLILDAKG